MSYINALNRTLLSDIQSYRIYKYVQYLTTQRCKSQASESNDIFSLCRRAFIFLRNYQSNTSNDSKYCICRKQERMRSKDVQTHSAVITFSSDVGEVFQSTRHKSVRKKHKRYQNQDRQNDFQTPQQYIECFWLFHLILSLLFDCSEWLVRNNAAL